MTKNCPYCGQEIMDAAIKCKWCKQWLNKENSEEVSKLNTNSETDAEFPEPIEIIPKEINFWLKLGCAYWINKRLFVKHFKYDDRGYIDISFCNGYHIEGLIKDFDISLINDPNWGKVVYIKKDKKDSMLFAKCGIAFDVPNGMTDEQNDIIFKILKLEETKLSKTFNVLYKILNFFK